MVVLQESDASGVFEREVRSIRLSGCFRNGRTAPTCNIIETVLDDFTAEAADFTRCDFKDNAFRSCRFLRCTFTSTSILFNTVTDSVFEGCSFQDTVIQDTEFRRSVFQQCDLSHILIKACTFDRCEFIDCRTSNKVFEVCRFTDCAFNGTELQLQSIAENFGITAAAYHGSLRDGRADGPHRKIESNDLQEWLQTASAHPLHKLSVEYFLLGTLLKGSRYLDALVDLSTWLPMFRTATSFMLALNQLVIFLIGLYDRDQLTTHAVVAVHGMTDELLKKLEQAPTNQSALASIGGAHLSLARIVDQYLIILEDCSTAFTHGAVFLVEGEQNEAYYKKVLGPLFQRADARISRLVPHNSPWELAVVFPPHSRVLLFWALFLATRTRIELSRVSRIVPLATAPVKSSPTKRGRRKQDVPVAYSAVTRAKPILSLEFGGRHVVPTSPTLRLRAYLPGDLLAELRLSVGSKVITRLRNAIKQVLSAS